MNKSSSTSSIRFISAILTLLMIASTLAILPVFSEENTGQVKKPTAADYAEGMVAWYNGAQNKRDGHDASAAVWEDLVGQNDISLSVNGTNYFTTDGFHLDTAQYNFPQAIVDVVNGQEFTVEMTLGELISKGASFNTFINSSNDAFSLFRRVSGDLLEFKFANNSGGERPKISDGLNLFANSTVAVTYKVGGNTTIYVDGVKVGEKPSPNAMGANDLYFGHADQTKNYETIFRSMRFYSRELTAEEVKSNAKADGVYNENILPNPGYVTIDQFKSNIIGDIALVRSLDNKNELDEVVSATGKPSTVIVKIDKDLNVLDFEGKTFTNVTDLLAALDYKIMVAFNVSDAETADALVAYLKSIKFYDCFVMSADPSLVKRARTALPNIRGIIDYVDAYIDSEALSYEECVDIRRSMKSNTGNIALLPQTVADQETIQALNDMIVNVWVRTPDKTSTYGKYHALLSGTHGIVSDDIADIYEASRKLQVNTMTRLPLNIGHRGMPASYPENTVEGSLAAYEAGANVIEIDVYLTTDGDIAVMHDANTGRTCNADLVVENSTMAQLKELYVNKGFENDAEKNSFRIPSFRDYLEAFKDKDCKIFVEIKSTKEAIVPEIKKQIEEYDMYDQCAIITFHENQMANVNKYYPEMSVGALCSGYLDEADSDSDMRSVMSFIGKYNATLNPSYSGYGVNAIRAALLRGIGVYPWTFEGGNYVDYLMNGYSGLTGNTAYTLSNMVTKINVTNIADGMTFKVGDKISVKGECILYNRSNSRVNGGIKHMIISGEDLVESDGKYITMKKEGFVTIVAYCTNASSSAQYSVYTQPITIYIEKSEENTTDSTSNDTVETPSAEETTADGNELNTEDETNAPAPTGCKSSSAILAIGIVTLISGTAVLIKKKDNL